MSVKGIDFSFGNGLTADRIKAEGYEFVGRYLSGVNPATGNPYDGKDITGLELNHYKVNGLSVIFFWETNGLMPNESAGVSAAQYAQLQLNFLAEQNSDPTIAAAPVFFAGDAADPGDVIGYLHGAHSIMGLGRMGIYGGYQTIHEAFNAGLVTYGCQTTAWSHGQWDDRALIRQTSQVTVGPADCDLDTAAYWAVKNPVLTIGDKFGQWPQSAAALPPPPPSPVRHISDGAATLRHVAHEAKMNVDAVIALTIRHSLPGNIAAMLEYVAAGNWSSYEPVSVSTLGANHLMPKGLIYYTLA